MQVPSKSKKIARPTQALPQQQQPQQQLIQKPKPLVNALPDQGTFNDDEFIEPVKLTGELQQFAYDLEKNVQFRINSLYKIVKLQSESTQALPVCVSVNALESNNAKELPKAGVDLICVIDHSGSMQGQKMEMVRHTLRLLLDVLGENDRICLVQFDDTAQRLTTLKKVTEANKPQILQVINRLQAAGGTVISKGTHVAFKQIRERKYCNNVTSVFLLSDGQDGQAEKNVQEQLTTFDSVFTMHSFGFGSDHEAKMMTSLSNLKNGSFYFVDNVTLLDEFFVDALGGLISVIAQKITIQILCDVKEPFQNTKILQTYGDMFIKQGNTYQINLPQLAEGQRKDFVLELELPKFNQLIDDLHRSAIVLRAKIQLSSTQNNQQIVKEATLDLTFFTENENIAEVEEDLDVAAQYYRVKGADLIDDARRACEANQFQDAEIKLDSMIEKLEKNKKLQPAVQQTISDLKQAKQAAQPKQFQQYGQKQMIQMKSNNYKQHGVNAVFNELGVQQQQIEAGAYQNVQQQKMMKKVQMSKPQKY